MRKQKGQLPGYIADTYPDFCGPTAFAAITGLTRVEAAIKLAHHERKKGRRHVDKSTHWSSMIDALEEIEGVTVVTNRRPYAQNRYARKGCRSPTTAQWQRRPEHDRGLWLLLTAHHFIVVKDGEVVWDNGYDPRRGRVVREAQIELSEELQHERKDDTMTRIYEAAQELINEYGIDPKKISGTGSGGAITKDDVEKYLEALETASLPSQQDIIRAGLEKGLSNAEIVVNVKELYPDSQIRNGWIAWTIGNERRRETGWWEKFGPAIAEQRGVKLH